MSYFPCGILSSSSTSSLVVSSPKTSAWLFYSVGILFYFDDLKVIEFSSNYLKTLGHHVLFFLEGLR